MQIRATVYIAKQYAEWQQATLTEIRVAYEGGQDLGKAFKSGLLKREAIKPFASMGKRVLPFAQYYIGLLGVIGAEALELTTSFDEEALVSGLARHVERELGIASLEVSPWAEGLVAGEQQASPGRPVAVVVEACKEASSL